MENDKEEVESELGFSDYRLNLTRLNSKRCVTEKSKYSN